MKQRVVSLFYYGVIVMKYKKTLFMLAVVFGLFMIYKLTNNNKINYLALGDSFAAGQNPYGEKGYGYTDYIKDYLKKENILENYSKDFTCEDDRIVDLTERINKNEKIEINGKSTSIQHAIEKADIITISIGSNDIYQKSGLSDMSYNLENIDKFNDYLDEIESDLDNLLKTVRKLNNKQIILIGQYNPLSPLSSKYTRELEPIFMKINDIYSSVAKKNNTSYIDIYEIFKENPEYLPNPIDIHPNIEGYEVISSQIINILKKSIVN